MSSIVDAAIYSGLLYLQGKVLYSLVCYDKFTITDDRAAHQEAFDHYTSRKKDDASYKVVPVACVLLTGGVFANVYLKGGTLPSLAVLLTAFLTAFNNGKNVVDPINALSADAKGDKVDLAKTLTGVAQGHLVDAIGFTAIFLFYTFL